MASVLVTSDQVAPSSVLRARDAALPVAASQTPRPSEAKPKTPLVPIPRVTTDQVCPASVLRMACPVPVPASHTPAPFAAMRVGEIPATP
ncbi:hypothetical protein D3C84_923530 [compost metagenome]